MNKFNEELANSISREPEIRRALEENHKQIDSLEEISNSIFERFNVVLRSEPNVDKDDNDKTKEEISSVPFVNDLNNKTYRLRLIYLRLNNMFELCEL